MAIYLTFGHETVIIFPLPPFPANDRAPNVPSVFHFPCTSYVETVACSGSIDPFGFRPVIIVLKNPELEFMLSRFAKTFSTAISTLLRIAAHPSHVNAALRKTGGTTDG